MDRPESLRQFLIQQKLRQRQQAKEHASVERLPESLLRVGLKAGVETVRSLKESGWLRDEPAGEFEYSPDYSSVSLRGKKFTLTPMQRHAVKILHEAWEKGRPEVGVNYILVELESGAHRLIDIFKSNKEAYRALMRKGERRGSYRLNL